MRIQIEETPNPLSLKFFLGLSVWESRNPLFIETEQDCFDVPLAKALWKVSGISTILLGKDFITITKREEAEWQGMIDTIKEVISQYFLDGHSISFKDKDEVESKDPIVHQILEILNEKIRPAVAQDGGDIVFHSFENGTLFLRLKGACAGCPSSTDTLKLGIERMIKYYVPEVQEVCQINA